MTSLEKRLTEFRDANSLRSKGQLAVMLHITRLAAENGLPIDPETLRTDREGQVKGLGKGRVQNILKGHGILACSPRKADAPAGEALATPLIMRFF